MLRNAMGGGEGGGSNFPGKKRYEGVCFNVISITRRWLGVNFPGKKRYVTLEWPLTLYLCHFIISECLCSLNAL